MNKLRIENRGEVSILGLIAAEILAQNLSRPEFQKRIKNLRFTLHLSSSGMKASIIFHDGEVEVKDGHTGQPEAWILAPMDAFLDLAVREIPWRSILSLRVLAFGRLFKLLRVLPLLQVHDPVPQERREAE